MIERRTGEIVYFQFKQLAAQPEVVHAVTTRSGGLAGYPRELNLSFLAGRQPAEVIGARRAVAGALGLRLEHFVVPRQVHEARVATVGKGERGRGVFDRESALPDTDAIITDSPQVALFVSAADCVPLLFFDPAKRAVGAAHAGWRGTVANVAGATVAAMVGSYGTRPTDLIVGIGPSIGPCCYTVGNDVVREIATANPRLEQAITRSSSGEVKFDLWKANAIALAAAGVREASIETASLCTACLTALFFSHRAEHGRAGRFGAIIALAGDPRAPSQDEDYGQN